MKPSWDDAPEWAQWLAMDDSGAWFWYEEKPRWFIDQWVSDGFAIAAETPGSGTGTLETRP